MRPNFTRYVSSDADFDKYKAKLKLERCPRCLAVGFLIRHGYLEGKGDKVDEKDNRGWRIFCSKRNRRKGCGKTFAVLKADFLYRRMVAAGKLWQMLRGIADGLSVKAAWEKISSPFCLETGYRLWGAFARGQTFIRSALLNAGGMPKPRSADPTLQVIEHLQSAFRGGACPVADFQLRFQAAFLRVANHGVNKSG